MFQAALLLAALAGYSETGSRRLTTAFNGPGAETQKAPIAAREADAPRLTVATTEVARVIWDRLPKQTVRSQIRFIFDNGDLWTQTFTPGGASAFLANAAERSRCAAAALPVVPSR